MNAPPLPRRIEIPAAIAQRLETFFCPGETPITVVRLDLDQQLHLADRWLVLTNQRLLVAQATGHCEAAWPLDQVSRVAIDERGPLTAVEIHAPDRLLQRVFCTVARLPAVETFASVWRARTGGGTTPAPDICPICQTPLPPEATECPRCTLSDDADEPAPKPGRSILRLLKFTSRWTGATMLGLALSIAATTASLVPPYLTMPLIDDVLIPYQAGHSVDQRSVLWYLGGLLVASIIAWVLGWARTNVLSWVSERIAADLRTRTYSHLQRLSIAFFGRHRTGDLIARVSTDTDRICYFLSVNLIDFVGDVLMIVITSIVMLSIDPLLALVTLAPLPIIAWLVHHVRENLRGGFAAGTRAWGEMASLLADTIPGIRVVKAFARENHEIDRFRAANDRVLAANDRVNRTWSMFVPLLGLLTDVGLLVVWAAGSWGVFSERIKVGVLTAFVTYITRFYARLDSMSRMLAAVQRAAASAHRVFEVMDMAPDVLPARNPITVGRLQGAVEFRDVSFRYGNRPIIKHLNLSIQPGEMIGVVGPSGSGKSTLVNLACRLYDVSDGGVFVDGTNVKDLDVESYRRNIGLVLQEPFLFYGTIADNIRYGRSDATHAEVIAAARAARAHDFILKQPDGYDSLVGERGQQLSGGERQRISIARALLINPALLILDEATSAVDTETEREIQLALDNLIRGRTTIAIAHRLSTLQKANRIIVLEDGEITETGSHEDLLARNGTYRRLHEAQLAAH